MKIYKLLNKVIGRILYPINPYWTANIYGFGKWIRRYGFYPPVLPICIYTDHGPGDIPNSPFPHELASDAPVQFYHAPPAVARWKLISDKPSYILFSPFVYGRRTMKIAVDDDANGMVYFPAHTTPSIENNKKISTYHQELSELPDKYRPVTICLHIHDVRAGIDLDFKKLGYQVVTAGDSLDQDFTKNFYNILRRHKFAGSDLFGSYALYAVEMGIPFGLFGSAPDFFNVSDPNVESGKYNSYMNTYYYDEAVKLFSGLPLDNVTQEQRIFAELNLGLLNGVTRGKMAYILYGSLFIWLTNRCKKIPALIIFIINYIARKI